MVDATAPDLSKRTLSDGCLLVAFEDVLTLALTESCPATDFRMGGRLYKDQGYGDWTGFYDWLRVDSDRIVGVRYWPFEPAEFLVEPMQPRVSLRDYVSKPSETDCIEVFFSSPKTFDPGKSDDQEFGSNRIFQSEQGNWLISFDTTRLSELEMQSIRAAKVRWEEVEIAASAAKKGAAAEAD